jgi:hypothetical protein
MLLNPSSRRICRIRRYRLCGLQKSLILFVAFTIVMLFCLSQYLFRDPAFRRLVSVSSLFEAGINDPPPFTTV